MVRISDNFVQQRLQVTYADNRQAAGAGGANLYGWLAALFIRTFAFFP